MKFIRVGLVSILAMVLSGSCILAQTFQGRILGRVTDSSGAVIPNATVTIENTGTGLKRVLQTNSSGDYFAPNLNPGIYSVNVEAPNFKTMRRSEIRLEVASDVRIDATLSPGAVSEVMQVTGEQPMVDIVTDTLGGTMTNKAINELPLQGRDFQNLLELRPGVQRTPGGGFHTVTSNGNRLEDNNYTVDGTDDNDVYYGETVINDAGVAGTPASHLPLDAIQEFNTQENQGAEYGWKPGAVVNIGLKSGTNDFHGTGYYFHRNSTFDARNYFNAAPQPVADLLLHEFGASAGGPIIKDKWFIFGNYEGVRHKVGNPYAVESPVTAAIGDPSISLADAKAAAGCPAACSPVSLQLADLFLSNRGSTFSSADPSKINFNFNNQNREDNFVVKSDYHLNQNNLISGRYFYANSLQTEEDTAPIRSDWLSIANTKVSVMGVNWTWTPNARWVNEARFGYNRYWQNDNVADYKKSAQSYGLNTGVTDPKLFGFPEIDIGTLFEMGGNLSWPLYTTPTYTYQAVDNVSITRGRHNIRFGGEFRRGGTDLYRARRGRGLIVFDDTTDDNGDVVTPALVNFLQGNFGDAGYARVLTGNIPRTVHMSAFGAFVADDWRILPRLTLNLGLRYDLSLPIKEANNQIANFIPSKGGLIQVGKGIDSPYDTDWNNFSPRIGFAFDMFGTGKTVLRGGGALIYEQPTIREFVDRGGLNENPSGLAGVTPGTGNIQLVTREIDDTTQLSNAWLGKTPLFAGAGTIPCAQSDPCTVFGVKPNLATPYVLSWNLNVQQEISNSMALQIGYVANRGVKLYSHRDINQSIGPLSFDCYNNGDDSYHGCRQDTRPFVLNCASGASPCLPWVDYANLLENLGNSIYNALQVTFTRRTSHGLDFLAGYTWSHAIDNGTSNRGGYPQDSTNFNAERGNGDYDLRHHFTFSMTYELPRWKTPLQLGEGWQITSILNVQSGLPYTLYDSYDDISYTGEFVDRWNFFGDPSDVKWTVDPAKQFHYYDYTVAATVPQCAAHASQDQLAYYGCFASGNAVLTPPENGTFGNQGRNTFRGPRFVNLDMSVTKKWKLSERMDLQLRGEFFNILNHPNFDWYTLPVDVSDPVYGTNDLAVAHTTPDVGASNPVVGSGGSRHIQLGAKLIW
ncbi:MAG: carboxypeptidase regulatory-like domain-containing protein [Acidobacteriia bacterium]|nr:carboxypeptidase regulatory-like domain-containing protein [Terriglobia bacterium]